MVAALGKAGRPGKQATKADLGEKLAPGGRQGHLAKGRAVPASVYTARAELGPRQEDVAGVLHTQDPGEEIQIVVGVQLEATQGLITARFI